MDDELDPPCTTPVRCRVYAWLYIQLSRLVYTPMSSAEPYQWKWWEDIIMHWPDLVCAECDIKYFGT